MNKKLNISPAVWIVVLALLSAVMSLFLVFAVQDAWRALNTYKNGVPAVAYFYNKGLDSPTKYSVYTSPKNEFIFQNIQGGKSIVLSRSDSPTIDIIYNPEKAGQIITNTFVDWAAIIINVLFPIILICTFLLGYKRMRKLEENETKL